MIFCTDLTFDLILRLRSIFRLGIHPYVFYHTSKSTMSIDAIMYSILPSEEFFSGYGLLTNASVGKQTDLVLLDFSKAFDKVNGWLCVECALYCMQLLMQWACCLDIGFRHVSLVSLRIWFYSVSTQHRR